MLALQLTLEVISFFFGQSRDALWGIDERVYTATTSFLMGTPTTASLKDAGSI